jgi:HAD superfamily hydrolase (TIGR01458 family)
MELVNKAFIIDLDGTLANNWTPLKGSVEFVQYLNKNLVPYCIVTNRVSKTVDEIKEYLDAIGFDIARDCIINSIVALKAFLVNNKIKTYFFVGPDYQKEMIPKSQYFKDFPEYVILCDFEHTHCDYNLFNQIYQYIRNGSKILATSYSNYYAAEDNYKMDTGIFVKMYELLTEKKATIIGKPSTEILKIAITKMKTEVKDIIIIGDDGSSDIAGGKNLGMKTVLVKTGVYKDGDEQKYKADITINSLAEIEKICGAIKQGRDVLDYIAQENLI